MARPNRNQNKEKIAVANIKNIGAVDVCYIGGSTFELAFDSTKSQKPMRFNIDALEELVRKGQVTISNRSRYEQIKSSILPDGSTATHNADGSIKSASDRTLEMLIRDGHAEVGSDGVPRSIDAKERKRREEMAKKAHQRNADASLSDSQIPTRRERQANTDADPRASKPHREDPRRRVNQSRIANEQDEFYDDDDTIQQDDNEAASSAPDANIERVPSRRPTGMMASDADEIPSENTKRETLRGDLNGDGIVDEFDDFVSQEQTKNIWVMIIFVGFCAISVFLFFAFYIFTAGIFHKEAPLFLPQPPAEEQVVDNTENANVIVGDGSETGVQEEQQTSEDGRQITHRTYDPEEAVKHYPVADERHQKLAVGIMQTIRQDYLDGDVKAMLEAINLDHISGQISEAYANVAKKKQSLSLPESEEVRESYKEYFSKCERQHVVDRDPYGSVFNGRIRSVRQENDSNMYIVMESIAGDHQRICLKAMANEKNQWAITNIVDAEGYALMISEGEQS